MPPIKQLFKYLNPALAALLWLHPMSLVHAQDYPSKPLHLVVPFAPGGGNDTLARFVAAKLGGALGQQVIVDNRAGANGAVGTEFVAKAAPDGYTLLLGFVGPLTVLPHMAKLGYDPLTQLAPVGLIANAYQVLAVHPGVPAKNVAELVALAKAQPGKLAYASGGSGTPLHLVPELFKLAAGVDLLHVPYKGSSPAALSTLAGDTQLIFGAMFSTLPQVKAGKLRALAVTSPKRLATAPDLPTLAESGYPGVEASSWYGLLVPAATPPAITAKLNAALGVATSGREYRDVLDKQGLDPLVGSPEAFRAFMISESTKWARVIKAAHIVVE
jgi:tripartite-type tricarboxylate transporter receptor subunit TctC